MAEGEMKEMPAPKFHRIFVKCAKCGGDQELRFDVRGFSFDQVKIQAGLLDGSSPMYVKPPDEGSCIGKCGKCGGRFKATAVPA